MMNDVVKFLQENPVQYLATVGRDGKAKCRPFMFSGEMDGKLWFCTNNQKDVYKDMQANPNIEISVSSPAYAWIRLNGEAVFENNMAAKEMCIRNPIVKGQYGEATNPIFEVFYLKDVGRYGALYIMKIPGIKRLCGDQKGFRSSWMSKSLGFVFLALEYHT